MIQLSSTEGNRSVEATNNETGAAVWSAAAVRLLQGVVYHDDNTQLWDILLANVSPLTDYFSKIGLYLVVDQTDAMAYLRQPEDDEYAAEVQTMPRLFRRTPMTYEQTLLCVLLRDQLRIFEEEDVQNEKCVVTQSSLLSIWQNFFPIESDSVKMNRALAINLRRLEEMKFVRQFEKEPPSWEVRRIIKARLPLAELENLQQSLLNYIASSGPVESADSPEERFTESDNS